MRKGIQIGELDSFIKKAGEGHWTCAASLSLSIRMDRPEDENQARIEGFHADSVSFEFGRPLRAPMSPRSQRRAQFSDLRYSVSRHATGSVVLKPARYGTESQVAEVASKVVRGLGRFGILRSLPNKIATHAEHAACEDWPSSPPPGNAATWFRLVVKASDVHVAEAFCDGLAAKPRCSD